MHSINKTIKRWQPSSQTRDSEFDNLHQQFKDLIKHVNSMQQQLKLAQQSWNSVFTNSKEALNTVDRAFGNESGSRAKEFANRGIELVTEWDQQNKDLRGPNSDTRFKEAEDHLETYSRLIKTVTKQVDKRNKLCQDLDYYRGKAEGLAAKDLSKDKDRERLTRAQSEEAKLQQEFANTNEDVKMQLAKVVEQKEAVFMRVLAAFMDVNRRIMRRNPFDELLRDYDYVLQGEWPAIEEYSPDFTPTYVPPQASRGPSQTNLTQVPASSNQSVSGGPQDYVRALYDFVAENPEELSFRAGDMIVLREVLDENWMHGMLLGREGIFPCNYVERV